MNTLHPNLHLTPLATAIPAWQADIKAGDLQLICHKVREGGGRLVALWGRDLGEQGFMLHVLLLNESGLLCLNLPISGEPPVFSDISRIFPAADRMQRAVYDLLGIRAYPAQDQRNWLRHAAWPVDSLPLRKDFVTPIPACKEEGSIERSPADNGTQDDYPFVQVDGQGVHEIPVGPVHAGIIEPGHFRFSVVGEKVLRLEARLGYTHKGIEKRFET